MEQWEDDWCEASSVCSPDDTLTTTTVVGCCECTGATAVMLGGGHGWLQGRYGLVRKIEGEHTLPVL